MEVVTADGHRCCARRERERRAVLGAARRRRQLRHRHLVRVPAAPGRARRSSAARSPGAARTHRRCSRRFAISAPRHRANSPAWPCCGARRRRRGCPRRCTASRSSPSSSATAASVEDGEDAAGAAARARPAGGRHRDAAAVHADAEPARCHAAQGAALLLEVALPAARRRPHASTLAARACRAHPLAALGDPAVPDRRRAQRAARRPLAGRQPRRRLRAQHRRLVGERRRRRAEHAPGPATASRPRGPSRPAAPTSTS